MERTPERSARTRRSESEEHAPSSRLRRRRQKEEQKRKYIPARLLTFLFLALPAAVLALHHVQSESGTVAIVRYDENSSRETVRIIRETDNEDTLSPSTARQDERPAGEQRGGSTGSRKTITHVVAANETLYSIAMKYYGTPSGMDMIKKENGLSSNRLQPGQTLRIPLAEKQEEQPSEN
ncbi:LysM peptidoglycan-binding domain-containing protein [Geobacillus sp. YF-1]|uniref:LysM peptidoglycan-binding domain-containing protein n=1 Tax=Geobacillus sp. YF-1 TaxID=3457480 RepID=UPI00404564EB